MKAKETLYANTREKAMDWLNEYVVDHTLVEETSAQCACGESSAFEVTNNQGEIETRIIVCEVCASTRDQHEVI